MTDARRTDIVRAGGAYAEAFGGRVGYGRVGCDRGGKRDGSHDGIHTDIHTDINAVRARCTAD
jgi:hypothetical protein